jgi:hypothetical protein
MPQSKKRPKPVVVETEYKSFNPTKSKFGKILILILAIGFVLSMLIAMVFGIIEVLQ